MEPLRPFFAAIGQAVRRGRAQPVGWDKEASCVSRTPLKGGTRAGRRLATEKTTFPLAIKK
jgi:hypothetical protein